MQNLINLIMALILLMKYVRDAKINLVAVKNNQEKYKSYL